MHATEIGIHELLQSSQYGVILSAQDKLRGPGAFVLLVLRAFRRCKLYSVLLSPSALEFKFEQKSTAA